MPNHQVEEHRGDWMSTFTGNKFYPYDPRPEDVHIEDIAHALSMQCRYAGHVNAFYSVAEHCVHMARAAAGCVTDANPLEALLHDAAEAYISDIVRPVKYGLNDYMFLERMIELVIGTKFGIGLIDKSPGVKLLDNLILFNEGEALFTHTPDDWHKKFAPGLGKYGDIMGWPPGIAEVKFLNEFKKYKRG